MKNRRGKIAYIDLFAGPGRYKDSNLSTPLLVLESAVQDPDMRENLATLFNDANTEYASALKREIESLPGIDQLTHKPRVEMEEVGEKIVGMFRAWGGIQLSFLLIRGGTRGFRLA